MSVGNLQFGLNRSQPYHRQKICYIPAERNMVTLPELKGFEFSTTNLRRHSAMSYCHRKAALRTSFTICCLTDNGVAGYRQGGACLQHHLGKIYQEIQSQLSQFRTGCRQVAVKERPSHPDRWRLLCLRLFLVRMARKGILDMINQQSDVFNF